MNKPYIFAVADSNTWKHWYFTVDVFTDDVVDDLLDDDSDNEFLSVVMDCEEHGVLDLNSTGLSVRYVSYEMSEQNLEVSIRRMKEWFDAHGYKPTEISTCDEAGAVKLGIHI